MKNYRNTILLIFGLALIYSGCKKDEPEDCSPPCSHDESFEAMLEWCYFEEGTWWLYQEETTLEKDCVYVWSAEMTEEPEFFELKAYTSHGDFDLYYFFYEANTGDSNVSNCRIRRVKRGKVDPPNFVGSGYIANFPVIEGDHSGDAAPGVSDGVEIIWIDSSYSVNGLETGLTAKFTVGSAGS